MSSQYAGKYKFRASDVITETLTSLKFDFYKN
jgi:hypothetical protein